MIRLKVPHLVLISLLMYLFGLNPTQAWEVITDPYLNLNYDEINTYDIGCEVIKCQVTQVRTDPDLDYQESPNLPYPDSPESQDNAPTYRYPLSMIEALKARWRGEWQATHDDYAYEEQEEFPQDYPESPDL